MWMTFAVITCTIIAYGSEKWSIEGVSLAALVFLLAIFSLVPQNLDNPVSPTDLLMGFANPALITVLALLVIGQALFNTDALEHPAEILSKIGGNSARRTILVLLVTAGGTSAFLNNTPVVVMFIPIIVAIAAQRNFSASAALMPLSCPPDRVFRAHVGPYGLRSSTRRGMTSGTTCSRGGADVVD